MVSVAVALQAVGHSATIVRAERRELLPVSELSWAHAWPTTASTKQIEELACENTKLKMEVAGLEGKALRLATEMIELAEEKVSLQECLAVSEDGIRLVKDGEQPRG